jgi:hypothetical protein
MLNASGETSLFSSEDEATIKFARPSTVEKKQL